MKPTLPLLAAGTALALAALAPGLIARGPDAPAALASETLPSQAASAHAPDSLGLASQGLVSQGLVSRVSAQRAPVSQAQVSQAQISQAGVSQGPSPQPPAGQAVRMPGVSAQLRTPEAAPSPAQAGLLAGFLVPAAVAQTRTPPAAAPATVATPAVPDALRGAWYQGECSAPSVTLQLTARAAARLPTDGNARLIRFAETRTVENWTMGIGRGAEAPRILLRGTATALETVEPDAKLRDDRLPGATPVQAWRRCPAAPASVAALHGEGVAFLAALEGLEAACGTGSPAPEACVTTVMREGDISGDGKLSVAEIARMVRGATWLLAIADEATPEAVLATAGGGMLGGVAVARLMMESLDYDGDGKLSSAELGQDRLAFGRATGTAAGRPLRMEGLQEGVALLRGVMEGLMLDQQR